MKTTIDLADALFAALRAQAAAEGVPMRSVIEDALRRELERRTVVAGQASVEDASYGSGWLREDFADRSLQDVIDDSYSR